MKQTPHTPTAISYCKQNLLLPIVMVLLIFVSCQKKYDPSGKQIAPKVITTSKEELNSISKINPGDVLKNSQMNEEIEKKLNEVLMPARMQLEEAIKAINSEIFDEYKEAVAQLNKAEDKKEVPLLLEAIKEKFYPYIKEVWEKADIDEQKYQSLIVDCFPYSVREYIRFTDFLNFSIDPSQKPEPVDPPAPPPAPAPENVCVNVHDYMVGAYSLDGLLVGGVRATVHPSSNGSMAEAVVSANGISFGAYTGFAWILNKMSIPGTFPKDGKMIRYNTHYDWSGDITAVAVLGASWATMAYSTNANATSFTDPGCNIYTVVAPLIFFNYLFKRVTGVREQLLAKSEISDLTFGGLTYGQAKSAVLLSPAYSHSLSGIGIPESGWTACEEWPN